MSKSTETFSNDALFNGKLTLKQPHKGYRFSVDAPLLVWFASCGRSVTTGFDLGAGCGVVGLGLLVSGVAQKVVSVELQGELANLANENASSNDLSSFYEVHRGDIRDVGCFPADNSFDLVVSNPPFWSVSKGRLPENEQRQIACHEVYGGINDWIKAAAMIMNDRKGRLCLVFPARRLDTLIIALKNKGLSCTKICFVHTLAHKTAELVLVEARMGKPDRLEVEPPLVLKNDDGTDTDFAATILSGDFSQKMKTAPDKRSKKVEDK